MLVSGTPGNEPRAVANVSRDVGFVHAATYLWAESEQDVLLETDHYYAFAISIDAQPVIDRIAFGRNTMAMTVYDLMRSVEFLIEHADADKDRIGTSGISLAGSIAPYFAAVDTRIKATAASCFVVNYRFTQLHQYECGSLVVPGLLEHLDNHEICSLIAPRYLLMERGVKNHRGIAENDVYRHFRGMYEIAECPERLKVDLFYSVHQYNGTKSLNWLDECL